MISIVPLERARPRERRVAIGYFDGVHLGHRRIVRGCDTVLTFEPHPRTLFEGTDPPKLLTSLSRKAELFEQIGVRELVVAEFDEEFSRQPPEAFVQGVLVNMLTATHVSVGANFRFGHRGLGSPGMLQDDGRFSACVAETVQVGGAPVSSTRIRRLIQQGRIVDASELLSTHFTIDGQARGAHLDRRGNRWVEVVFPAKSCVPRRGQYRCLVDAAPGIAAVSGYSSCEKAAKVLLQGREPIGIETLVRVTFLDDRLASPAHSYLTMSGA